MKKFFSAFLVLACVEACSSDGSGGPPGGNPGSGGSAGSGGTASGGATSASGGGDNTGGGGDSAGSSGTGGLSVDGDAGTGGGTDGTNDGGPGGYDNGDGGLPPSPLVPILDSFGDPDVPKKGPMEGDPIPPKGGGVTPPDFPGEGIAQHPMLYAGEGHNVIYLVNKGKVIWTYSTGSGGEIDDVWMLSNGNILYARMNYIEEITRTKQVVWHHNPTEGGEIHSVQPIGLDKVLFVQNAKPVAKIFVMNIKTDAIEVEHPLPDTAAATQHAQFRRIRMTATGGYLAPYLNLHKVVEYDKDFNEIWNYPVADTGNPWTAVRLHNGNTLIQDEKNKAAREVSPNKEIVWEMKVPDLPVMFQPAQAPQTSERLVNGNTILFGRGGGVQAVEVTPAKMVVWVLKDTTNLGPATTAQILDEPGIPERPGDLQH
jgi:hypothetical protein